MKQFTKEQIERTREYFRSEGYEEKPAMMDDCTRFTYFVIPQSKEPNLEHFVLRMTGKPEDGSLFGISDSVPVGLRKYPVFHEVIEFLGADNESPGKCQRALVREIRAVPEYLLDEYARMRESFFTNLLVYVQRPDQVANYTLDDLKEFQGSLDFLRSLRQQFL